MIKIASNHIYQYRKKIYVNDLPYLSYSRIYYLDIHTCFEQDINFVSCDVKSKCDRKKRKCTTTTKITRNHK